MKNLVFAQKNRDLNVFEHNSESCGIGDYRVIYKCRAGFLASTVVKNVTAINAFRNYDPKSVHSIAYIRDTHDSTVYARVGKKVWIAESMLVEFTVGDINQALYNTALYNQHQYKAVNASSWASKAYVMNEEVAV